MNSDHELDDRISNLRKTLDNVEADYARSLAQLALRFGCELQNVIPEVLATRDKMEAHDEARPEMTELVDRAKGLVQRVIDDYEKAAPVGWPLVTHGDTDGT